MSVVVERRYSRRSNRKSWVRNPPSVNILGSFLVVHYVFCHIAEAIDAARRCLLIFISFLFFPHAFISRLFLFSRLMMDSRAGAHTQSWLIFILLTLSRFTSEVRYQDCMHQRYGIKIFISRVSPNFKPLFEGKLSVLQQCAGVEPHTRARAQTATNLECT